METTTRIRKIYTPLSINVAVRTSGVPLAQLYDQFNDTLTNKREEGNPSILTPVVEAMTNDEDPSWTNGNYAKKLTSIQWLANGEDIDDPSSSVYADFHNAAGVAYYSIDTSKTDTNGSLSLWLNPEVTKRYTLQLRAKLNDDRTGLAYTILSDGNDMYVNVLGDSEWDFSVVHDVNVRYSPCYDKLRLYDYLVSIGKITGDEATRKEYCDGLQYDLNMPILITHGHAKYTPDDSVRFRAYDHNNDPTHANPLTVESCLFLTELTTENIRVDQRFMNEREVLDICLEVKDSKGVWNFQSQEQLTFTRWMPTITATPTNTCDIDLTATTRTDHALVMFSGKKVDYPLAYLSLKWYARTSTDGEWVYQGEGEDVTIDQKALGVFVGGKDYMEIKLEYDISMGYAYLTNEKGEYITNDDGAYIIVTNF